MQRLKQFWLKTYFRFLGSLARGYLKKHQIRSIGINGSVGKTSCRMILTQTLKYAFPQLRISTSPENFNGELGLSLSVFEIEERNPTFGTFIKVLVLACNRRFFSPKSYDLIILEYGIDTPGEMDFLLSIHKPHVGIFTAIDAVHSLQFGDPAAIAQDEIKMVLNTRELVFLNLSDSYAQSIQNQIQVDLLTYQTIAEGEADLSFAPQKFLKDSDYQILSQVAIAIRERNLTVQTNLLSKPDYAYLSVALALTEIVAFKQGITDFSLERFIQNPLIYQLQPGRLSLFAGLEEHLILDSSYNASPLSMRRIIDTAVLLQKELLTDYKLLLVLGDMRELGDLTASEHRLLAGYVQQSADQAFLLGASMQEFLADELLKIGFSPDYLEVFSDYHSLSESLLTFLQNSDEKWLVVCKGSQNTIFMEEVVKALLKNPEDQQYLTRQSAWWMRKKEEFLFSLLNKG